MQMFWDEEATEIDKRRKALDDDFQKLLSELMNDYRKEIEKHLPSLEKELKAAIKYDAFGNVITQEGKDEEVWSYFAQKNLWENIFSKEALCASASGQNIFFHLPDPLTDQAEASLQLLMKVKISDQRFKSSRSAVIGDFGILGGCNGFGISSAP